MLSFCLKQVIQFHKAQRVARRYGPWVVQSHFTSINFQIKFITQVALAPSSSCCQHIIGHYYLITIIYSKLCGINDRIWQMAAPKIQICMLSTSKKCTRYIREYLFFAVENVKKRVEKCQEDSCHDRASLEMNIRIAATHSDKYVMNEFKNFPWRYGFRKLPLHLVRAYSMHGCYKKKHYPNYPFNACIFILAIRVFARTLIHFISIGLLERRIIKFINLANLTLIGTLVRLFCLVYLTLFWNVRAGTRSFNGWINITVHCQTRPQRQNSLTELIICKH